MFGYVTPARNELRRQDYVLYRAFYCGVCKCIGKRYGSLPRFTTSYDVTFLSLLLHDAAGQRVELYEGRCVGNPFRKKMMVLGNALMEKLCAANIILTRFKLRDDVIDGGGAKKKLACRMLGGAYRKAKALFPEADEIVSRRYDELRGLEKAGETSVDRAAHSFASMLRELAGALLPQKNDDNLLSLCYNIGKFVYLADALDDFDDDLASGNYNPFAAAFGREGDRKALMKAHGGEIAFALNSTVNRAIECFNGMDFDQSYTLLRNIVYDGLRGKASELLSAEKKLPAPRI